MTIVKYKDPVTGKTYGGDYIANPTATRASWEQMAKDRAAAGTSGTPQKPWLAAMTAPASTKPAKQPVRKTSTPVNAGVSRASSVSGALKTARQKRRSLLRPAMKAAKTATKPGMARLNTSMQAAMDKLRSRTS